MLNLGVDLGMIRCPLWHFKTAEMSTLWLLMKARKEGPLGVVTCFSQAQHKPLVHKKLV